MEIIRQFLNSLFLRCFRFSFKLPIRDAIHGVLSTEPDLFKKPSAFVEFFLLLKLTILPAFYVPSLPLQSSIFLDSLFLNRVGCFITLFSFSVATSFYTALLSVSIIFSAEKNCVSVLNWFKVIFLLNVNEFSSWIY